MTPRKEKIMETIKDDYEALVFGLWLSITAPTEEKSKECVKMAESISAKLTKEQVERAKAEAERHVRWHE